MGSYFVPPANFFFNNINATGNVTANIFIGNGQLLSGVRSTLPFNANVDIVGNVTAPGNIIAGGVFIGNGALLTGVTATLPAITNIDIRGNVIGAYANVANVIALQGNVGNIRMIGGNLAVSGQINSRGNVVAPLFIGSGLGLTGVLTVNTREITADLFGNVVGENIIAANVQSGALQGILTVSYPNLSPSPYTISSQTETSLIIRSGILTNAVIRPDGVSIVSNGSAFRFGLNDFDKGMLTNSVDGQYALDTFAGDLIVHNTKPGARTSVASSYDRPELTVFNGNVGIRTTTPLVALDVNGDVNTTGNIVTNGQVNAVGNVVGNFFVGNGSLLTGITGVALPEKANIDIKGNVIGTNVVVGNVIAVEGNVGNIRLSGGNVDVSGQINVLGNVVAPLLIGNLLSAGGNIGNVRISGGNIAASGQVNVRGNVVTSFFIGNVIAVEGNVGNIRMAGGNVDVSGQVNVAGNVVAPLFIGNVIAAGGNIGNIRISGGNVVVSGQVNVRGNVVTSFFIGNVIAVEGNVGNIRMAGGNVDVSGQVNVLGNVAAPLFIGNIIAAGGNIGNVRMSGGNIAAGGQVNVAGNVVAPLLIGNIIAVEGNIGNVRVSGGNIAAGGQVNVLGNVVGNFFIGNGSLLTGITGVSLPGVGNIDTKGNVIGAYANVGNIIASQGNVGNVLMDGGNLIASGQVNVTGNVVAPFFIGNGSSLFGITSTATSLANGTSNVSVTPSGNVTFGVTGVSNVVTVDTNSLRVSGNIYDVNGQLFSVPASYMRAIRRSVQESNVPGTDIIMTTITDSFGNDITLDTATGIFTLLPGKTYRLRGSVGVTNSVTDGAPCLYYWVSKAGGGNVVISATAEINGLTASNSVPGGTAEGIITPTVVTPIAFRFSMVNGDTISISEVGPRYAWTDIQVIGGQAPLTLQPTANVDIFGNVSAPGNITALGQVNVAGNVVGNFLIGNVIAVEGNVGNIRMIGGNVAVSGQVDVAGNVVSPLFIGNIIAAGGNIGNIRMSGGNIAASGQVNVRGNVVTSFFIGNVIAVEGNVGNIRMVGGNVAVSGQINVLGNVVGNVFIGNVIANAGNIGNVRMSGGNVAVSGQVNVAGNVVGNFFVGDGSLLTNITVVVPANSNVDIKGNQIGNYSNVDTTLSNTVIISYSGNGNALTVSGTDITATGTLIQGTSGRPGVNTYSLLRLDTLAARVLDIDGGGVITANSVSTANMVNIHQSNPAYNATVLNIDVTRPQTSLFNFITCQAGDGATMPFLVNGDGVVNATGVVAGQVNTTGNVVASFLIGNVIAEEGNVGNIRMVGGNVAVSGQVDVAGNVVAPLLIGNVIAAEGNVGGIRMLGGNVNVSGQVNVRGNVVGNVFIGNVIANAGNVGNIRMLGGNVAVSGQVNVLGNVVGRVFIGNVIATEGVIEGPQDGDMLAIRPLNVVYTSSALGIQATRGENDAYDFITCKAGGGASTPFSVNGRGDVVASIIKANTAINSNIFTAESLSAVFNNSVIQAIVPRNPVPDYTFFNCRNVVGNMFNINGTGAVLSTTTADVNMVNIVPTNAAFTSSALNIQATRAGDPAYDFITCKAGEGATTPFYVNGRGDVSAGIVTANSTVNANIFTAQALSGAAFTSTIMHASAPAKLSTADYTFIDCVNQNGKIFTVNGNGSIVSTGPQNTAMLDLRPTAAAFTSSALNIQATRAENPAYDFITCKAGAGATTPFSVDGKGSVSTSGDIIGGNTARIICGSSSDILRLESPTLNSTGTHLQATTIRTALNTYSFLRFDNNAGRVLDINGQGTIQSTVQVNAPMLNLSQTGGIMTNDVLRVGTTSVAGGAQYNMIAARNAGGNVFRVNGVGTVFGTGAYQAAGADYAEMFEWEDGNATEEDRRGTTVVVGNNGCIRVASVLDNPVDVFGVVSVNPSVVGDTKWNEWEGRYLRDKFGSKLSNALYYIANVSNLEEIVRCGVDDTPPDGYEKVVSSEFVENPAYDSGNVYIPREMRPEWDAIGLVGKLRVLPGQMVNPGWKLLNTINHPDGNTLEYLVK